MRSGTQLPVFRVAIVFIGSFLIAIPWWWRFAPAIGNRTLRGAPLWFVTAVVGSVAISVMTIWYLGRAWQSLDEEDLPVD